jgi:non-homologous end joining protein Ku
LSGTRQLVLVRPVGRLLAMDVLHYPAEVRAAAAFEPLLRGPGGSAEEIQLTCTLIEANGGTVDWLQFRDVSAEELTALIEAKIAGRPLRAAAEKPVAVLRLLDALKQSVASVSTKTAPLKAKSQKSRSSRRNTP